MMTVPLLLPSYLHDPVKRTSCLEIAMQQKHVGEIAQHGVLMRFC